MPRTTLIALLFALSALSPVHADPIGSQDFNSLSDADIHTTDMLSSGSQLTNGGSQNSDGSLGLTFASFWIDTRGVGTGPTTTPIDGDSGDFIGVNSFGGGSAPNVSPDGTTVASGVEHNFEFNDGDGRIELRFDPVPITNYKNVVVSLNFWISSTGYESDDNFQVAVSDGITTVDLLNFGETELEANASADDGTANWKSLSVDVSALGLTDTLWLLVAVDTNASAENIFIDNVAITGDLVIPVAIDVKPGSDTNPINLKSNSKSKGKSPSAGGVIPVAILTTDNFDATTVDPDAPILLGDPDLGVAVAPIRATLEDVDGDGDLDVLLHFSIQDLVEAGAIDDETETLALTASTLGGAEIAGMDSVTIVP